MASITIRDLEPELKERLRVQAARNGRSMEEEARVILRSAVAATATAQKGLGTIHRRFKAVGGVEFVVPPRLPGREPPEVPMIILDTNVVSELMRTDPSEAVVAWVDAQVVTTLHTTSVTEAEVMHGVLLLPKGKRRNTIFATARAMFEVELEGRILAFDSLAATAYAEILTVRRAAGCPMSPFDAQIAAITTVHGARLATRNISDFVDCGIDVVDPWNV